MGINELIQVGNRIKEFRKLEGLTQKEVAERAGIAYSTYSNYENNNREPSLDQLQKIINVLNIPMSALILNDNHSREFRTLMRERHDIEKDTVHYSIEDKTNLLLIYDEKLNRIREELDKALSSTHPTTADKDIIGNFIDFGEGPQKITEYFNPNEYTAEELEDIRRYAEFVKSKRPEYWKEFGNRLREIDEINQQERGECPSPDQQPDKQE